MSKDNDTTILSSIVKKVEPGTSDGVFSVETFTMSGEPHARALLDAALAEYVPVTAPPRDPAFWEQLVGKRLTLLLAGDTMFGAKVVKASPVTLFKGSRGGVGMLPKGARRKGFSLRPDNVIDYVEGFDGGRLFQGRMEAITERLPRLAPVDRDTFTSLPERASEDDGCPCTVALFGTLPFPEGDIPGSIWLLHSHMKEDGILEGVLIVPPGQATSEHGSAYLKDFERRPWGRVEGFTRPVPLAEALALCDAPYGEVLARLRA